MEGRRCVQCGGLKDVMVVADGPQCRVPGRPLARSRKHRVSQMMDVSRSTVGLVTRMPRLGACVESAPCKPKRVFGKSDGRHPLGARGAHAVGRYELGVDIERARIFWRIETDASGHRRQPPPHRWPNLFAGRGGEVLATRTNVNDLLKGTEASKTVPEENRHEAGVASGVVLG